MLRWVIASMLWSSAAWAVPLQISHQGRMLNDEGVPLEGEHSLHFSLYNGAKVLWSETQTVQFSDGHYLVALGEKNPLESTLFDGSALQIGRRLDEGKEDPDRIPVVSVPYAMRSGTAEHVAWEDIEGVPESISAPVVPPGLTEEQVRELLKEGPVELGAGTTLGGKVVATGDHVEDTDTTLSESDV